MDRLFTPDYYSGFHCIADLCRHSCCIGWEIDIDPASLARYRAETGDLGQKLSRVIQTEEDGTSHFILEGEAERCPFLNDKNLCELILMRGEDALCGICTDHPRFRNFFSDHEEMGLGLCCEEASRLILSQKAPMAFPKFHSEDPDEQAFYDLRDSLFAALSDRTRPLLSRMEDLCTLLSIPFPSIDSAHWGRFLLDLERLDPAWEDELSLLCVPKGHIGAPGQIPPLEDRLDAYDDLLEYFLFRHLPGSLGDGRLKARVLFSVLSTLLIAWIGLAHLLCEKHFSQEDLVELSRMFSSEIEYSDENVDLILEEIRRLWL